MTWETYHAANIRQLPRGARLEGRPHGIAVTLPCKHGHDVEVEFGKLMPANGIYKALQQRGWKFPGARSICPEHANNNRKESNVRPIEMALTKALQSKPAPVASPPAKHAKRDALRWLDESFDTVKGCYKGDMSDQKIADETGLSVKAIVELRAEFGYDLKTPPEIVAMQEEAAGIRDDLAHFRGEAIRIVEKMCERLDTVEAALKRYEAKS